MNKLNRSSAVGVAAVGCMGCGNGSELSVGTYVLCARLIDVTEVALEVAPEFAPEVAG